MPFFIIASVTLLLCGLSGCGKSTLSTLLLCGCGRRPYYTEFFSPEISYDVEFRSNMSIIVKAANDYGLLRVHWCTGTVAVAPQV